MKKFLNFLRNAPSSIDMGNTDSRPMIGCFEWRQCCSHSGSANHRLSPISLLKRVPRKLNIKVFKAKHIEVYSTYSIVKLICPRTKFCFRDDADKCIIIKDVMQHALLTTSFYV